MQLVGIWMAAFGLSGTAIVLALYPGLLLLRSGLKQKAGQKAGQGTSTPEQAPLVSVIVAMRNAQGLIGQKVACLSALEDPGGGLEIILASDGSSDATLERAHEAIAEVPGCHVSWHVLSHPQHRGKQAALNDAFALATGAVLVFSDVDAVLPPDAVRRLVAPLLSAGTDAAAGIGGVCGQRRIGEMPGTDSSGQATYIELDSRLKSLESACGSITSNDGKLFAIRAELFETIPEGVTDDLFTSMVVVRQGWRFVFEPRAVAWIRKPSRSRQHEVTRRRRIVSRSLRGIWIQRAVLNPSRTGLYGVGLAVNKVGRRLLPFFLGGSLLGLILLLGSSGNGAWGGLAVAGLALLVLFGDRIASVIGSRSAIGKALYGGRYALVGLFGTALGVLDFARARTVTRWEPMKAD